MPPTRHAPGAQERYLPCSVEWYLANCYAVRTEHGKDGRKQRVVVIPEGEVTPEKLHGA